MNLVVTGEICSGKTTWCSRYSQWLTAQKFTVGGILCPEAKTNDARIGYDVVDVHTGRAIVFGRISSEADFAGEPVGNYVISYEGLEFAKLAIQEAVENKCDMIFIDEVGHLELAGGGIIEATHSAYQKAPNTMTVVRKSLLTTLLEYFHLTEPAIGFTIKDIGLDPSYPLPKRRD